MSRTPTEIAADPAAYIRRQSVPAWIFDQETLAFLDVNPLAIERYGYSRAQFLQMTLMDIRPSDDVQRLLRKTLHPHERGPSEREDWRHMRSDGTVFDVSVSSFEVTFQGRRAELVCAIPAEAELPATVTTTKNGTPRVLRELA